MKAIPTEVDLLVGGHRFHQKTYVGQWCDLIIQQALEAGKSRFGHALCLCRPTHLKLQIRLRDGKHHLAVWPLEAERHDSECIFFKDDLTPNDGKVLPEASSHSKFSSGLTTQAENRLNLNLAFRGSGSSRGPAAPTTARLVAAKQVNLIDGNDTPISIKRLLMFLWERADLCRWHPSWTRDWGRVRFQLDKIARELTVNNNPLEKLLFVPKPYREAIKDQLDDDWELFFRSLPVAGHRRNPQRILISAVRQYTPATPDHPAVVHLRHLRYPIFLSNPCDVFINRDCPASIKQLSYKLNPPTDGTVWHDGAIYPEVMGCFLVEGNSRGGVFSGAAWMMNTHPTTFIPAANAHAVRLVDELVRQGYSFARLMSVEPAMARCLPDWIIRHVIGPDGVAVSRAALAITGKGYSAEFLESRRKLAGEMAGKGVPTWNWFARWPCGPNDLPILPPHQACDAALTQSKLTSILNSNDVEYRYG